MLISAFAIGIYSYAILILGLLKNLTFIPVLLVTAIFLIIWTFFIKRRIRISQIIIFLTNLKPIEKILLLLISITAIVNLLGALGSELAFDALWYHLTIPKLYIASHQIYFIEDSLFYYNLMPKLTEMLYTAVLVISNETAAKLTHFLFGILSIVVLYKIARLYLPRKWSLTAVLIFYSNLVVSWLSITAYSDLVRVFFESFSLYYFLLYLRGRSGNAFYLSALLLGFAICAKVTSIGSIPIFMILTLISGKLFFAEKIKKALLFLTIALVVPLPWFLIAFFYVGNPVYPLFTELGLRGFSIDLLSPIVVLQTIINTFLFSADPISPVYVIFLPALLIMRKVFYKECRYLFIYSVLAFVVWYFFLQEGGSRFLTVILLALSVVTAVLLRELRTTNLKRIGFAIIFIITIINIFYRFVANMKYVPVILGIESKQQFLMRELNFSFGDFYDQDNRVGKFVNNEVVLLINMHNLFYVNFPFVLSDKDPKWNGKYILIQDSNLPDKYKNAKNIYQNPTTHVTLYKLW